MPLLSGRSMKLWSVTPTGKADRAGHSGPVKHTKRKDCCRTGDIRAAGRKQAPYLPHISDKTIQRVFCRAAGLKRLYGACGVFLLPATSFSGHMSAFSCIHFSIFQHWSTAIKKQGSRRFPVNTAFFPTFRTFAFSVRVRFLNVRFPNVHLNKYPPFEMFSSLYAHSFLPLLFPLLPLPIRPKQDHFPHCHNHDQ